MIPIIRTVLTGLALLTLVENLFALEIPAGGTEISDPATLTAYVDKDHGKAEKITSPPAWRIEVAKAAPERPFLAQSSVACSLGGLSKGDKVLVIVKGRATTGSPSTLNAKLQLAAAPYTEAGRGTDVTLPTEWTEYPLLFTVENPIPEGKGCLTLLHAKTAQTVELSSIRVIRYPAETDVTRFPRIRRTYAGREPNAPWRKAAMERIETLRKADFTLKLTDARGTAMANQAVKVTLRRHEFGFGSATPAAYFSADTEDARRFRDIVDRLFSIVVFENDLKDFWWGNDTPIHEKNARREELNKAFAWLGERQIAIRGHYLMQVAIPGNAEKMDAETARRHFMDTARERIAFVGDRVCEWDAINHPIAWSGASLFRNRPGLEHLDREVFTLARSLTQLPLWVNEDQLFRPGPQSDGTLDYLRDLKKSGFKIDGLGNQAHIHESYLPTPEHVLAITDQFAEVVPRQSVTEFDIMTVMDEDLAADYTRDLMIACFSHPAYTSFLLWGFWEGSHWMPETASWNKDWSIKKRGEVLEEWLGKRWRTELTLTTDANGTVKWRGFPGWYQVSPQNHPGSAITCNLPKKNPSATVSLPADP